MAYKKEHDEWNKFKKILDELDIRLPFKEGDIWWIALGTNIGIEIDGKGINHERPGIIIRKFNKDHLWVVPLSRRDKAINGMHIVLKHPSLQKNTAALITQLRTVSNKRLLHFICTLSRQEFQEVLYALNKFLPIKNKGPDI